MKFYICLLCIYMVNFKYSKDTYLHWRVSMAWIVPLLCILRHRISNRSPSEKSSLVIYTYWKHQYYIKHNRVQNNKSKVIKRNPISSRPNSHFPVALSACKVNHGLLNIRTSTLPCVWKIPDALFENETLTKCESI